jgi:hypothetical protein
MFGIAFSDAIGEILRGERLVRWQIPFLSYHVTDGGQSEQIVDAGRMYRCLLHHPLVL